MTNAIDDKYQPEEGLEVQHMPDGFVVYQPENEKVHYLNPTASIVFELCGAGQSKSAIAGYLQKAFSLDEPPLEQVDQCIADLLKQKLITLCET
ncbi:MAG: PqqD family protein [Pseudomonadota bacterium]